MNANNSYIVVLPWMMTALGLSANSLLCYALIYGYSQGGNGGYWGSRSDLAEALNISRRAATDVLDRLEAAGHLKKQNIVIDGVQRCLYRAVVPEDVAKKPKKEPPKVSAKPAQRFTPPTIDEVQCYCRERGNTIDAQRFYDYYTANGWTQGRGKPIKDWRAAVRLWEQQERKKSSYEKVGNKERIIADRRAALADEVAAADERFRAKMAGGAHASAVPDGL